MSTRHRNAGGPFVIFDPGLGISGSLEIDGLIGASVGFNEGVQIATNTFVTGTLKVGTNHRMSLTDNELDVSSGDLTLDVEGNIELNADGGTITFKDGASTLGTITSAGFSGTATTVTLTDNESTAENNLITFVANGATSSGAQSLEMDGDLHYNPSTGTVTATTFAGALSGNATTTTALATGRTLKVDLTSTSTSTAFDGTAALTDIGVNGTLSVGNGGTGLTSITTLLNSNVTPASLGLAIGTNVQAYDAGLQSISGLTTAADKIIYTTDSDTYAVTGISAFARTLLDDADAAAVRTTLGLGALATHARIDTTDFTPNSLVTESEGIASSDNDTSVPTSAAVKAYADSVGGGSSFSYLQEAGSPSGNSKILIANDGNTFPSSTVKEASLVIKSNTNSGSPGTGGAAIAIHDDGSNAGWQIYYDTGDGNLMFVTDGIATGYQMLDSISGTNTISTSFTGQHRCLPGSGSLDDYRNYVGFITETTGEYRNFETDTIVDKPSIDQSVPKIKLATTRNSKKVFGIVSGIEEQPLRQVHFSMSRQWEIPDYDRRVLINSIGEGGIWVCNINGNLENGDYITACEIEGYGMKQDDDLLHNYTVAKITCDCNFDLNSSIYDCEQFIYDGITYKKAFVGCTYHCG